MANFIPALDNGAQNLKFVYKCLPLLTIPVPLSGFAPDTSIQIDKVTNTNNRIGLDGLVSSAVKPVLVTGRLYLQFNSIGAGVLRFIQETSARTGVPYPGVLEVIHLAILPFTITFNNFILTEAFTGPSTNDSMISDVEFEFNATLPDSNIFNDLTNLAALGISFANGVL